MRQAVLMLGLVSVIGAMQGCSSGTSDVPPEKDKALRENFSRPLNAEEIAHMNAAPSPGAKKK